MYEDRVENADVTLSSAISRLLRSTCASVHRNPSASKLYKIFLAMWSLILRLLDCKDACWHLGQYGAQLLAEILSFSSNTSDSGAWCELFKRFTSPLDTSYFRSRFYHMSTELARSASSIDMVSSHHLLPHPLFITNFSSTNVTEILNTPTLPTRIHTAEQHIIVQTLGGDNTPIPHTSSTPSPIQASRPIPACRAAC